MASHGYFYHSAKEVQSISTLPFVFFNILMAFLLDTSKIHLSYQVFQFKPLQIVFLMMLLDCNEIRD